MTEEQKQALIEFLKFLIAGSAGQHKQIYEIALASLTAEPVKAPEFTALVPKEMPPSVTKGLVWRSEKEDGLECYHMENLKRAYATIRAAILRNIEEAK